MYSNNMVLLWEVSVYWKKFMLLFVFIIMRMFSPFKKTMGRGSSLKFAVLKNYQNNRAFAFPTKSNLCNSLFLNAVSK